MERDPLERLLRTADGLAGPPPMASGPLGERVRRLARHRHRRNLAAVGLVAVGLVTASGALLVRGPWSRSIGPQNLANRPGLDADARLAHIQAATDELLRQWAARETALVEASRQPSAPVRQARTEAIEEQLECSAFLTVYQGDRYYQQLNMPESAMVAYRETIRLFPKTRAARTAQARLAEYGLDKEKSS